MGLLLSELLLLLLLLLLLFFYSKRLAGSVTYMLLVLYTSLSRIHEPNNLQICRRVKGMILPNSATR